MTYQFFNLRNNGFLTQTVRVQSKTPLYDTAARLRGLFGRLGMGVTVHPILGRGGVGVSAVDLLSRPVKGAA